MEEKLQTVRTSKYKLTPMNECLEIIANACQRLSKKEETIETRKALNRVNTSNIYSDNHVPSTNKSQMDGYALNTKTTNPENEILVLEKIYTGKNTSKETASKDLSDTQNKCVYITTGGTIPTWCNVVVPIEYTTLTEDKKSIILTSGYKLTENKFIRNIGSDIQQKDLILFSNSIISVSAIALLLSCKVSHLKVYKQPTVGIISTGDEIFDLYNQDVVQNEELSVDSNKEMLRQMLIQTCHINENNIIDLGNLSDNYDVTEEKLNSCQTKCDILISSGGVSMGEKDLVKLYFEKNSNKIEILFGRINMKPGKPSTLAKISDLLFFALPGNPMSCFVTFHLLINYAVNLFQNQSTFPLKSIAAKLQHNYTLDMERPEYARGFIYYNTSEFELHVVIKGNQQSSRIKSAQNSNCLVAFPRGNESKNQIKINELIDCLLLSIGGNQIGSLNSDEVRELSEEESKGQGNMCGLNHAQKEDMCGHCGSNPQNFHKNKTDSLKKSPEKKLLDREFTVGLVTVSDRASKGEYIDESTPAMEEFFQHFSGKYVVKSKRLIPDEKNLIEDCLKDLSDNENINLICSSGGTGLAERDVTPEATKAVIEKEATGISTYILNESMKITKFACLSRPVVGVRKQTLIVNLPGNPKAVKENLVIVEPILKHALNLITKKKDFH